MFFAVVLAAMLLAPVQRVFAGERFFSGRSAADQAEVNETEYVQTPLRQKVVPASRFWNDSC
jgi:hypothetical protein